jgi:hypothetical protein
LNSRTTRLYHLSELQSKKANNPTETVTLEALISPCDLLIKDSQFWFVFERRMNFNEPKFKFDNESVPATNNTVLGRIKFFRGVHVKLSYGALTSMNDYYHHPAYDFVKRTEWMVSDLLYFVVKKKYS